MSGKLSPIAAVALVLWQCVKPIMAWFMNGGDKALGILNSI